MQMILIILIIVMVGHGFFTTCKLVRDLHILQLNSYFNNRYWRWLVKNKAELLEIKHCLPFKEPSKKPLVYTPRAKRLLSVNLVLLLFIDALAVVIGYRFGVIGFLIALLILFGVGIFSPILMMVSNALLIPIENSINHWYYQDAKKIIGSLPKLLVIGITGSFGKTSTKFILREILQQKFHTLMTPGSYNTTMGVTKVIRSELKPTHEIFIAEVSAKKRGDIKELCDLLKPKYGLITAIGEQHLDTFKSLENIILSKNELIESLPGDGVAFLNFDNIYCRELAQLTSRRVVSFGIDSELLDYQASEIKLNTRGCSFKVERKADHHSAIFQTKLLGQHNIYNILGAIAIAGELGMTLSEMVYPVRQLQPVPHRLELRQLGQEIVYIDDAFNSNPVGSKMALEVLRQIAPKRKIIVTPGMIELGEKEDFYNQQFGEMIAEVCDYVILVGIRQTAAIHAGLQHKNFTQDSIYVAKSFDDANQHLQQMLQPGDVVLFENDLPDNYET